MLAPSFYFYLLAALLATGFHAILAHQTQTERWKVKTVMDADSSSVDFTNPMESSVRTQATMPQIHVHANTPRQSEERTLIRVHAYLLSVKLEADGDYHLIIQDNLTRATMLAEIPDPDAAGVRSSSHATAYRNARTLIESVAGLPNSDMHYLAKPIKMIITGVGFFDESHIEAQEGNDANCRELHPVVSIEVIP
ncbi:MAG: hypothetical protein ABI444_14145 [Candidatus Kapaibacterium sp.]|jgi:hypothetical protein